MGADSTDAEAVAAVACSLDSVEGEANAWVLGAGEGGGAGCLDAVEGVGAEGLEAGEGRGAGALVAGEGAAAETGGGGGILG